MRDNTDASKVRNVVGEARGGAGNKHEVLRDLQLGTDPIDDLRREAIWTPDKYLCRCCRSHMAEVCQTQRTGTYQVYLNLRIHLVKECDIRLQLRLRHSVLRPQDFDDLPKSKTTQKQSRTLIYDVISLSKM